MTKPPLPGMTRENMRLLALFSLSLIATACSLDFDDAGEEETGRTALPILHGAPDMAPEHNGIVRVVMHDGDQKESCSGTVIAERTVLTAAHCLDEDPDWVEVGFGYDAQEADWIEVVEYWLHPDYGVTPGTAVKQNDIAILRLTDMPAGIHAIAPLPPSEAITGSELNSTMMHLVGYGLTETESSGTRRTVSKTISYLCSGSETCTWYWKPFYYAYVAPGNICHRINPAGTCYGDSGGPALVERDGVEYIAGVNSWVNTGCENIACATKVDQFDGFITAHLPGETDVEDVDAGIEIDAGPGIVEADAGPVLGSQDASSGAIGATADETASGGCSASQSGSRSGLLLLGLLLLLRAALRDREFV